MHRFVRIKVKIKHFLLRDFKNKHVLNECIVQVVLLQEAVALHHQLTINVLVLCWAGSSQQIYSIFSL